MRSAIVAAVAALGLGGVVWWAVGEPPPAPRPPKVMRNRPESSAGTAAARPVPPVGAPSADAPASERVVESTLRSILLDVATGVMTRDDEPALVEQLREALALEGWGDVRRRHRAAQAAVATLLTKAEGAPPTDEEDMTDLQRRAIAQTAAEQAKALQRQLTVGNAPRAKLPSGHQPLRWSTLTGFAFEPGMNLPETVSGLQGQTVALDGYMLVLERDDDRRIRSFLLLESLWGCCFARTPKIHEGVEVRVTTDRGVVGSEGPVQVLGELDVGERREEGEVTSVYRLRATAVRPLD